MGIHYFPSEFVYWVDNPKHSQMKDELMKKIMDTEEVLKINQPGILNAFTSFSENKKEDETLLFLDEYPIVQELVFTPFKKMIEEYNKRENINRLFIKKAICSEGWYTKYETNGNFEMHNHDEFPTQLGDEIYQSSFSFIYILNDKNKVNTTRFLVPSMQRTSATKENEYNFDTGQVSEIKEGSIIVFPSSLYHEVKSCIIPGRITISYNLKCCYA
jgi:hypothetical protein|tara:strand:+ start:118 stop:765 length:648 start_codon:yes stop_codon:yes gene_type:complete